MTPREMIFAHRYGEAAEAYAAEVRSNMDNEGAVSEYATALLCVGEFRLALDSFRRANSLANRPGAGESNLYLEKIGTAEWLLGDFGDAIGTFSTAVDGILDGSVGYADMAGGVSQGLLLWYAGVTASDAAASEHALKYLRKLAGKSRIQYWPGPLALFALGETTEEEVLQKACGIGQVDAAVEVAKKDLLKRRHLVNALFYFGVRERANGREEQCRQWMRRCLSLENPIIECEWYLARGEAAAVEQR